MVELTVKVNRENLSPLVCDLKFPAGWNELTERQFLYIARYWEAWQSIAEMGESMRKARALLMLELCGLDGYFSKKKLCHMLSFVDENTNYNILDCTNFVFEKLKLTKNHLPKINMGPSVYLRKRSGLLGFIPRISIKIKDWYYGPADFLSDISIDEFSFAFSCYLQYGRTGNEEHLDNLVAVLYRPESGNYLDTGRRSVPFTPELINVYAQKTKKLKYWYKQGVLLFFMGFLATAEKKYGHVFRRAKRENTATASSFLDTIIMMSGGKFGPFDTTKRENLHVVLKELNYLIEKSQNKK